MSDLLFTSGLELSFFSGEFPTLIEKEQLIGLVMTGFGKRDRERKPERDISPFFLRCG
jgi:hypothetical protein